MVMNYLGAPTTQVPTGTKMGLPYGIQVSATAFNDRLTIAVAKELESFFGGWIKPCEVKLSRHSMSAETLDNEMESIITNSTGSTTGSDSSGSTFEQVDSSLSNQQPKVVETF